MEKKGAGLALLGLAAVGAWLLLRRKAAAALPGDTLLAEVEFEHLGPRNTFTLQVSLGDAQNGFIPATGMVWSKPILLPASDIFTAHTFQMECRIPAGASPGTYDAEVVIKLVDVVMARMVTKNAVVIGE